MPAAFCSSSYVSFYSYYQLPDRYVGNIALYLLCVKLSGGEITLQARNSLVEPCRVL